VSKNPGLNQHIAAIQIKLRTHTKHSDLNNFQGKWMPPETYISKEIRLIRFKKKQ
jgi:hypothetical protein